MLNLLPKYKIRMVAESHGGEKVTRRAEEKELCVRICDWTESCNNLRLAVSDEVGITRNVFIIRISP